MKQKSLSLRKLTANMQLHFPAVQVLCTLQSNLQEKSSMDRQGRIAEHFRDIRYFVLI